MVRYALIALMMLLSGCFDSVHQDYFTINDLPFVPGSAFGKQIYIKRNPIDKGTKLIVIRDDTGYHYYPLGADDSNFLNQIDTMGIPKPSTAFAIP